MNYCINLFLNIKVLEVRVSHFDPLTKLPNRRVFQNKIEKKEIVHSIAMWQFQDMELHNQEHGYLFVDRLINHIANILKKYTPPMTDLYRGESNRFTFVTRDRDAAIELHANLGKLSSIFKEDFYFEDKEIGLKGVCAYIQSENGESLKKIYSNAMAILKHPSIDYNFDIVEYNPKFHTRNFTEEILDNFEDALINHDIFIVYQSKIEVNGTKVKSVEALIRWQHPIHGFLSPGIFLPILEANDLMNDLTDWIIEQVCIQLKKWEKTEHFPQQVAINIPGPYLTSTRLLAVLSSLTKKYKVDPSTIELEITETSFVKTITSAEKSVRQYRSEGFSVALDDFGTGVSSLSYLKRIPISTLKIDKSFIDDVPNSEKDNSILKSMIQLARSLNMNIVVEGIETIEQVNYLIKECGSPCMQGFYFAKPMQAKELEEWCALYPVKFKESVPPE